MTRDAVFGLILLLPMLITLLTVTIMGLIHNFWGTLIVLGVALLFFSTFLGWVILLQESLK
jgi:uncharacterized membrane protein